jgi:hypothetical protein
VVFEEIRLAAVDADRDLDRVAAQRLAEAFVLCPAFDAVGTPSLALHGSTSILDWALSPSRSLVVRSSADRPG